jgi:hypothetical protein
MTAGAARPAPRKRSCARARLARVCTHWHLHAAVHSPPARRGRHYIDVRERSRTMCIFEISLRFLYAEHTATGTQVNGEGPVDLRDQIKAAGSRLACGLPVAGAPGCGPGGL